MEKYSCRRERKGSSNPSFSSTLLDTIYRSIDEGGEEELVIYRETMRKKQQISSSFKDEEEMANFQRICMIEKWMEKKQSQRRRSLADFGPKARDYINDRDGFFFKSSSSSSDSSSNGCGFSSSEVESMYGVSSGSSCYGLQKPKHEDGFTKKTKSRALKIYGDLKKSKQPISPGAKLASFLTSLLNNTKKSKKISSRRGHNDDDDENAERKSKSANSSTCSSASSFSRSCLTKTPSSSRGKSNNTMKRSVRFYPVSVIVDEDCQPCGHKNLYESKQSMESIKEIRSSINEELKLHIMEKNRRVEEAARDLSRNYQKRVELEYDYSRIINVKNEAFNNGGDDDDDDDDASCASSDLFELDNLSAIGMDRYREELPVYETTRLDTNIAIANGMIL